MTKCIQKILKYTVFPNIETLKLINCKQINIKEADNIRELDIQYCKGIFPAKMKNLEKVYASQCEDFVNYDSVKNNEGLLLSPIKSIWLLSCTESKESTELTKFFLSKLLYLEELLINILNRNTFICTKEIIQSLNTKSDVFHLCFDDIYISDETDVDAGYLYEVSKEMDKKFESYLISMNIYEMPNCFMLHIMEFFKYDENVKISQMISMNYDDCMLIISKNIDPDIYYFDYDKIDFK